MEVTKLMKHIKDWKRRDNPITRWASSGDWIVIVTGNWYDVMIGCGNIWKLETGGPLMKTQHFGQIWERRYSKHSQKQRKLKNHQLKIYLQISMKSQVKISKNRWLSWKIFWSDIPMSMTWIAMKVGKTGCKRDGCTCTIHDLYFRIM